MPIHVDMDKGIIGILKKKGLANDRGISGRGHSTN